MKIKQEVEYQVTAKAVLREDVLSLSVTVGAPYGQRSASESRSEFPESITKQVQAALKAAITFALQDTDLITLATGRAHEARKLATIRGEEL